MANGKLYEIEINESLILHKGDMRFVDNAFMSTDKTERKHSARKYGAEIETDNPLIEILVNDTTIAGVISKDQIERSKYLLSWSIA